MSLKTIRINPGDRAYILDGNENGYGCGTINNDGHLYLIDKNNGEARMLPDHYARTPICLLPSCGGYKDGRIMVSMLGELDLQYHHNEFAAAGLWGWIDIEGKEIIPPQFVFAKHFMNERAVVCRGTWSVDGMGRYWCENEEWGIIDPQNRELIPCRYDALSEIENTQRYVLCHKGGWKTGCHCIYDVDLQREILNLDFNFDNGYMFNRCLFMDNCIIFDEHIPGGEMDYIYIYSIIEEKWVKYQEPYREREYNGQRRIVVHKDGEELIVF